MDLQENLMLRDEPFIYRDKFYKMPKYVEIMWE